MDQNLQFLAMLKWRFPISWGLPPVIHVYPCDFRIFHEINQPAFLGIPMTNMTMETPLHQWEFQDTNMEVLYHTRPYFAGIFPYIGLKNRPYIW